MTGFGDWTDKLGYSCVPTQLNTFYPSHKQSKRLFTVKQLSLLNSILREAVLMKIQVLCDMHRVKRQRITDDSRQPIAPNFATSAPRRVKYFTIISEDSNPLGCEAV
jgi:hypothetical protein